MQRAEGSGRTAKDAVATPSSPSPGSPFCTARGQSEEHPSESPSTAQPPVDRPTPGDIVSAHDDWRPTASFERLRLRARILREVRAFFEARGVLEVETPYLSVAAATEPHLYSLRVAPDGPGSRRRYLHTSPEFPMKRLLAAGAGPIFQICRVFREGEAGALHNPEFTLLEWYRPGWDHHALMQELAELAGAVIASRRPLGEPERVTYREAFERHAGIDPLRVGPAELLGRARALGLAPPPGLGERADDRDALLDLLSSHLVQPRLGIGRPCLLYDYPASQAALARVRAGDPPVAERFELFVDGIELANGFHELTDAGEQGRRFAAENERRRAAGHAPVPIDERFLAALEAGVPDCAGVALGLDRLIMLAAGAGRIDEVLAFPFERA